MSFAESWEIKMKRANHKFATIQTIRAIFDRAAIITDLSTIFVIEYIKGNSKNKNLASTHNCSTSFSVKQKNIAKKDIEKIKYYKN